VRNQEYDTTFEMEDADVDASPTGVHSTGDGGEHTSIAHIEVVSTYATCLCDHVGLEFEDHLHDAGGGVDKDDDREPHGQVPHFRLPSFSFEQVWVSTSGLRTTFAVHYKLSEGRRQTKGGHDCSFVGFRNVVFMNQEECLVSFCLNCMCKGCPERDIFDNDDSFATKSRAAFLNCDSDELLCPIAASIRDRKYMSTSVLVCRMKELAQFSAIRSQFSMYNLPLVNNKPYLIRFGTPVTPLPDELVLVRQCGAIIGCLDYYIVCIPVSKLSSYGMVHVDLVCNTCKSHAHHCEHVKQATFVLPPQQRGKRMSVEDLDRMVEKVIDSNTGMRSLTCISREQLPERPDGDPAICETYSRNEFVGSLKYERLQSDPCVKCSMCEWLDEVEEKSLLVSHTGVYDITFVRRCCAQCGHVQQVDGREFGIFRKTRCIAFGHDALYRLNMMMGTSSFPSFSGYFKGLLEGDVNLVRKLRTKEAAEEEKRRIYNYYTSVFQDAFFDFVDLMKIDYTKSFSCSHVGAANFSLVIDGVTVAYKKQSSCIMFPTAPCLDGATVPCRVRGSLFPDRMFVPDSKCRKWLYDLGMDGLSVENLGKLCTAISSSRCAHTHTLVPLLLQCETPILAPIQPDMVKAPSQLSCLFMALGSGAPACQIAKPSSWCLLEKVVQSEALTMQELQALSITSPSLSKFVRAEGSHMLGFKDSSRAFIAQLVIIAQQCFVSNSSCILDGRNRDALPQAREDRHSLQTPFESPSVIPLQWSHDESYLRTGTWCVAALAEHVEGAWLPSELGGSHVARRLRSYEADYKNSGNAQACTKHKESHNTLLPGMCLGWCADCNKCIFLSVMSNCESPRTLFELLYTHFQKPPARIIYDNACNAEQYVLNRECEYFKGVQWCVDHMHFAGHKHCAPDYDTALYSSIINASMAEQRNAIIRCLENSVSYMNQDTFLFFVRHFVHCMHNNLERRRDNACFWAKKV
jgi:hypothetical protein